MRKLIIFTFSLNITMWLTHGGVNGGMRNKYRILNGKLQKKYYLRVGGTDGRTLKGILDN